MKARLKQLDAMEASWRHCKQCERHRGRSKVVTWRGSPEAPLMIIGSAPSADDDQQGLPYSGARGRALDQLLSKAGLVPSKDVFVVNVVGCGRTSQDAPNYLVSAWDLQACYPRLEGMARITAPGAFLVMGSAARALVLARGRFAKVQYRDGDLVVERAAVRTSSIDSLLARTDYDQSGLFDSMVDDVKVAWELANAAS